MRWGATAESIEAATKLLVGDVFLAAGCIAYLGAFTGPFRWVEFAGWKGGRRVPQRQGEIKITPSLLS